MHIAVVGLGPAGALVARRAVSLGWTVEAFDPACESACESAADTSPVALIPRWRHTYGIFPRDLPDWAREFIRFSSVSPAPAVCTPRRRLLEDAGYGIVDVEATRQALSDAGPGLRLHRRRISDPSPAALGVDAVIDCRGVVDRPGALRQVAYGVVVDGNDWPDGADPVFMDWRQAGDTQGTRSSGSSLDDPSFLYVQPVDGGLLVEETFLVTRRPAREAVAELRERLYRRAGGSLQTATATATETVRFPVDRRTRPWYSRPRDGVTVFGAAGGLTHPATGYSVALSAAAVDDALTLVADGSLPLRRRLSAGGARLLRIFGAELLVRADATTLTNFFDAFFALPPRLQRGYLAGQGAGSVLTAMLALARFPRRTLPFLRPSVRALYCTLRIRR